MTMNLDADGALAAAERAAKLEALAEKVAALEAKARAAVLASRAVVAEMSRAKEAIAKEFEARVEAANHAIYETRIAYEDANAALLRERNAHLLGLKVRWFDYRWNAGKPDYAISTGKLGRIEAFERDDDSKLIGYGPRLLPGTLVVRFLKADGLPGRRIASLGDRLGKNWKIEKEAS